MAASAESQRRRYAEYKALIAQSGDRHARTHWQAHLSELRKQTGTSRGEDYALYKELAEFLDVPERAAWVSHLDELRRRLRHPETARGFFRQWWLRRFTLDEIKLMGHALDFLSSEEERAA